MCFIVLGQRLLVEKYALTPSLAAICWVCVLRRWIWLLLLLGRMPGKVEKLVIVIVAASFVAAVDCHGLLRRLSWLLGWLICALCLRAELLFCQGLVIELLP